MISRFPLATVVFILACSDAFCLSFGRKRCFIAVSRCIIKISIMTVVVRNVEIENYEGDDRAADEVPTNNDSRCDGNLISNNDDVSHGRSDGDDENEEDTTEDAPTRRHTLVPSLAKTAYLALAADVRDDYDGRVTVKMHVRECCARVSRLIADGGRAGPGDRDLCETAAGYGHGDCLQIARETGCPWDAATCAAAASGHPDCLEYARRTGCPWDAATCHRAAFDGRLECLRFAHRNGCPWDATTCSVAASNGHLECLRYARANGCPWDASTCAEAAAGGWLECLRYARANGCPWDADTCVRAAVNGYPECLRFAIAAGCPWDADRLLRLLEAEDFEGCVRCCELVVELTRR